ISGVVSFDPDDFVTEEAYLAPIHVVRFEKYGEEDQKITDHTTDLLEEEQITLAPDDRFFRLNVRIADYFNSENIQYQYKVDGLFEEFQTITTNVIELGRLPYGKYQLIVRGQSANKEYSEKTLALPLVVQRPLYLQGWFLVLAAALLICGLVLLYRWRIKKLQDREQRLKLLVSARTAQIQQDKDTIEKQAAQLQELDALKSRFFANISHELRTPLTLILAPLSNLLKTSTLSSKQQTQLMLMRDNGQKLLKRINELLDISRIDANKLAAQNQPVFLYPFLKTLLATFESSANLKKVQLQLDFQLDDELQFSVDRDKLETILMNYLNNALKFTPKGGTIKVLAKREEEMLQLSVSDTGIGIPLADLPKIFDRFYQVTGTDGAGSTNASQGTGIGLSLCQELAKVMDGRVWATSEIGKGSTFYVALPLVETFAVKQAEEEPAAAVMPTVQEVATTSVGAPPQRRILVVEDNPDLRTFLQLILADNYQVVTAENGKEAWELLVPPSGDDMAAAPPSFSAIISDIMMPEMDGMELLTRLKASDELRHLPVILLTARKLLDVKIDALRIGVDDYLTKPFKAEELLARVDNLVQNAAQRVALTPTKAKAAVKGVSIADTNWLREAESILLQNIENGEFTLNQLAEELYITPRTLQSKIKHITGKTPKQYQRDLQMHVARQKIKTGEVQTIAELGYQLGFDNPYYFAKLYKKYYGVTPKEDMRV
ncbi:MAG: ATP-binding protein, partial [Bacteroidota bacterium]